MKTELKMLVVGCLAAFLMLCVYFFGARDIDAELGAATTKTTSTESTSSVQGQAPEAQTEGGADDQYKLIVGANPRVAVGRTLTPPEGSVAITNEAQLQLLIEEAKQQHASKKQ